MIIFMRSYEYEMLDVVIDDPYVPTKRKTKSEKLEPKLQNEWTEVEVKKVQINFKVINTIHCALNPTEFSRISTCKSTKEIWEKFKVTHKGTMQVKESKITFLSNQYKIFKMQSNESITSWFDRYTTIVNQLNYFYEIL